MALTSTQIIQLECSDLYDNPNVNTWISYAQEQLASCVLGDEYNRAVALLACHMYSLSSRSLGSAGNATSIKEGGLAVGFSSSGITGDLGQTSYGVQLKNLLDSSIPAISVLGNSSIYCE